MEHSFKNTLTSFKKGKSSSSFYLRQAFRSDKRMYTDIKKKKKKVKSPAVIEELNREADDFIICDNSLVLVGHLSTVLIRSIGSYLNK